MRQACRTVTRYCRKQQRLISLVACINLTDNTSVMMARWWIGNFTSVLLLSACKNRAPPPTVCGVKSIGADLQCLKTGLRWAHYCDELVTELFIKAASRSQLPSLRPLLSLSRPLSLSSSFSSSQLPHSVFLCSSLTRVVFSPPSFFSFLSSLLSVISP